MNPELTKKAIEIQERLAEANLVCQEADARRQILVQEYETEIKAIIQDRADTLVATIDSYLIHGSIADLFDLTVSRLAHHDARETKVAGRRYAMSIGGTGP
jgi:hypothetical protein